MKSTIIGVLTGCILLMAETDFLKAQENEHVFVFALHPKARSVISRMENLSEMKVNIRAVRDFYKQFKKTDSVVWRKVPDGYTVKFSQNGEDVRAGYDFKGYWLYNMRSYPEDRLPPDVWHEVKSTYYNYAIIWVNEITKPGKKIYLVHLKNKYFFLNVKIFEGEMEEMEQLKIEPL